MSEGDLNKRQLEEKTEDSISKLLINLLACTFQTVFGYICLDVCVSISLHYIGQEISPTANAGYGFALTCVFILLTPFGFGLNQSLNMHTSQALGDQKVQLAKRFFNINLYVMLFILVPLGGLLLILKYPLSLTIREDQREATSDYSQEFLYYLIPAIILALEFESAKCFMVAHKVTYPFTIIHFCTLAVHWFLCWLFIVEFQWGVSGAGVVIIITEVLNIVGLVLFVQFTNLKREIFQGTKIIMDVPRFKKLGISYIKTSIPIVLHIYSEFFVFFLLSFIALSLGVSEMIAHIGLQNMCGIYFRIPISLSIAMMSFVGSEMGKGNIKRAKFYVAAGLVIFAVACVICSILIWFFRNQLATFYASDQEENELAARAKEIFTDTVPWLIGGMLIVDGLQGTLSGALKGINKINLVFYSTIIAYYLICIPLVSFFTYSWGLDQGVLGIWQGFGISNLILAILDLIVLFTTDWDKQSRNIVRRVKQENELQFSTLVQLEDDKANI
ncbi:unnamed protein product (macronuclear) [Paramecium tetraurelia]|uniref:Uncharacterized protein n=1 Tax=Paramecium tetraurelia TaxID=5888 RepID=A0CJG5_PARTE|nr:uncharacterized protein GSPATT00000643001 [Paramecium tetraurelia]CAK70932.1 unnamed protein product [Paramecium tetraurelia]|eukprot:XP_001438329.1 hypothetical protein (macronuclear) [Paramecium tetraurelia strain d4-2]